MSTRTHTRRDVLAGAAAAIGTVLTTQRASAQWADDGGAWAPSHITHVGDDPDELAKYQPRLTTTPTQRSQLIGVFGWYAESEQYDTRAYNYWLKYTHQNSLTDYIPFIGPSLSLDSHLGDHEPITVFVDPDTGEVQEVLYTGYHHFATHLEADNANLSSVAVPNRATHTSLEVVEPHHHYELAEQDSGVLASETTAMESFLDAYDDWADDGVFNSTSDEAVHSPWSVRDSGTWWDESTIDYQFARIQLFLNIRDEHDDLIRG